MGSVPPPLPPVPQQPECPHCKKWNGAVGITGRRFNMNSDGAYTSACTDDFKKLNVADMIDAIKLLKKSQKELEEKKKKYIIYMPEDMDEVVLKGTMLEGIEIKHNKILKDGIVIIDKTKFPLLYDVPKPKEIKFRVIL